MSPKNTAYVPQTTTTVIEDIAIEHLDLAEIAEAQADGGAYALNVLDLEHIAPMHPNYGLGRDDTLNVIVLHHHKYRVYFPSADDPMAVSKYEKGAISAPACSSWDGVTGYGNPGGACAVCPYGQFGGPCKPQLMVYGLEVDKTLPVRISVPTTSLKNTAFLRKAPFEIGKPLYAFIVVIGRADSKGKEERMMTFSKGPNLSPHARAAAKNYAASFRSILEFPAGAPKNEQKQLAASVGVTARPALTLGEPSAFTSTDIPDFSDDVDNTDIPF